MSNSAAAEVKRASYQVKNWSQYNDSLVNRGDITLWFDDSITDHWNHDNVECKVGRPYLYSDSTILCLLMLKVLFRLPYRQTEGLGRALLKLANIDVKVPDYTSLAKRAASLEVNIDAGKAAGPIDLVVDSTGLKVFGEGEWKVRQHGADGRRTWRKLHLAVNPATHEIEAQVLTDNATHDGTVVNELLDQVSTDVKSFRGDGAYDQWAVYERLERDKIDAIIPPRSNAKIKQHGNCHADPKPRDCAIRAIRAGSKSEWKKNTDYHLRSNAETAMSRIKSAFGERLQCRKFQNQVTEAATRCKLLNWFVALGMPLSIWS